MTSIQSFYFPGSIDVNDNQIEDSNIIPPPLYLWSRPDWTATNRKIAEQNGHLTWPPRCMYQNIGIRHETNEWQCIGKRRKERKERRRNEGSVGVQHGNHLLGKRKREEQYDDDPISYERRSGNGPLREMVEEEGKFLQSTNVVEKPKDYSSEEREFLGSTNVSSYYSCERNMMSMTIMQQYAAPPRLEMRNNLISSPMFPMFPTPQYHHHFYSHNNIGLAPPPPPPHSPPPLPPPPPYEDDININDEFDVPPPPGVPYEKRTSSNSFNFAPPSGSNPRLSFNSFNFAPPSGSNPRLSFNSFNFVPRPTWSNPHVNSYENTGWLG